MSKEITTLENTLLRFKGKSEAFIIAGASEPDGKPAIAYQGDIEQLKYLFRLIRDTLKEKEKIGNHPNR